MFIWNKTPVPSLRHRLWEPSLRKSWFYTALVAFISSVGQLTKSLDPIIYSDHFFKSALWNYYFVHSNTYTRKYYQKKSRTFFFILEFISCIFYIFLHYVQSKQSSFSPEFKFSNPYILSFWWCKPFILF